MAGRKWKSRRLLAFLLLLLLLLLLVVVVVVLLHFVGLTRWPTIVPMSSSLPTTFIGIVRLRVRPLRAFLGHHRGWRTR